VCEIFSYGSFHCNFFSGVENRKDSEKKIDKQEMKILICPFRAHVHFVYYFPGRCRRAEISQAFSLQNQNPS
jgi:hypothetical protein